MSFMSNWTCQNFVDVAAALGTTTPPPPPPPTPGTCNGTFTGITPNLANGQSLVAANGKCNSCHGTPNGASAASIYSYASHMSFMSNWTCQNFVDVAAALGTTTPPPPPACTSYKYTLGACQPNGTAPVTSSIGIPAGCSGGTPPPTTEPCTYVPPTPGTCTSFTYNTWGACQSNGTRDKNHSSSPAGCTGGTPVTSQSCAYVPPPTGSAMPLPTGEEAFPYDPIATPQPSSDPSQAMPMGLGAVATGGNTITLRHHRACDRRQQEPQTRVPGRRGAGAGRRHAW